MFQVNGYTMLIDRELYKLTQEVTVDYISYGMRAGFQVTSKLPIGGGSACGGSCSC